MSRQLLAFGLFLGSLLVLVPEPTTAFTAKLLGNDNTFGEVHVEALDKANRVPIPNGNDVFPAQNVNNITRENVDFPTSDEISLDISVGGAMTKDEIDKVSSAKPSAKKALKGRKKKTEIIKYIIDCTHPVEDGIMDIAAFLQFLRDRFKVNGKTNNFGRHVHFQSAENKITITADISFISFSKRYLKYLAMEFLEKDNLRNWLEVIATSKDTYELRYINNDDEEEDSDE